MVLAWFCLLARKVLSAHLLAHPAPSMSGLNRVHKLPNAKKRLPCSNLSCSNRQHRACPARSQSDTANRCIWLGDMPPACHPPAKYLACRRWLYNKKETVLRQSLSNRQLPILPARLQASTFGVYVLNYCVRNGNRWSHIAIITGLCCCIHLHVHTKLNRNKFWIDVPGFVIKPSTY